MIAGVLVRLRTYRRERALAGEQRAGSWARARARRLQYGFVRRKWRGLLIVLLVGSLFLPSVLLLPPWSREYAVGAWLATELCLITFGVVLFSGSTYLLLADAAEQWTRDELRSLRRQGWKAVHRVLLRPFADIDHVAIGPGGVLVVETKGGTTDWKESRQEERIRRAADQVRRNARDIRMFLRPVIGDAPVRSIVAVWPSDDEFETRHVEGVTVLAGQALSEWAKALPTGCLDPRDVDGAWSLLDKHLAKRDEADLRRDGPPPQTISGVVFDIASFVIAAICGLLVVSSLTMSFGWPLSVAPSIAAAALAALVTRTDRIHYAATGLFVGIVTTLLALVGLTVALAIL